MGFPFIAPSKIILNVPMGGKYLYLGLSLGMASFHVLPILSGIINIPKSFRIFLSALLAFKSSVFDYVSLSVSLICKSTNDKTSSRLHILPSKLCMFLSFQTSHSTNRGRNCHNLLRIVFRKGLVIVVATMRSNNSLTR